MKRSALPFSISSFAELPPLGRSLKIRSAVHSVAAKLARDAGYCTEPYLTFPERAPGVSERLSAVVNNDAAITEMVMVHNSLCCSTTRPHLA
ncbi:hypothetical protein ACSVIJ_05430 [Pseudomonas sp. NCHU5208]|uniref:hypothetical protein n=1 Tax=unclassified Pseudomonas TaxID=196821 RepID=UPI003F990EEE